MSKDEMIHLFLSTSWKNHAKTRSFQEKATFIKTGCKSNEMKIEYRLSLQVCCLSVIADAVVDIYWPISSTL